MAQGRVPSLFYFQFFISNINLWIYIFKYTIDGCKINIIQKPPKCKKKNLQPVSIFYAIVDTVEQ